MTDTPVTKPVPGDIMSKEPAQVIAWIVGFFGAILAAFIEFGLDLTGGQQSVLLLIMSFVAPILAGYIIRRRVVSPETAQKAANTAATTGVAPAVMEVPKEKWGIYQGTGDGTI